MPGVTAAKPARISNARKKALKAKRDANAARRTKAATLVRDVVGAVAEPDDEAALAAIAKRTPSPRKKRSATERLDDPPPATGPVLIERLGRAIERELTLIERVVGGVRIPDEKRTEAERRARTLASLARTLAEVRKLRAEEKQKRPDDDAIPRDLDELRRALSRRLEQMVERGAELPAAGDERG